MRILAVLTGFLLLSGCAQMEEIRQRGLAIQASNDDARCSSYGLTFDTPEYAQCRIGVDRQRDAAINQVFRNNQEVLNQQNQQLLEAQRLRESRQPVNCTTLALGGGLAQTSCQ